MSHEQAQAIMALVEQHRQHERRVANRYMVLSAILVIATIWILLL
jgi:hypothetical protein